MTLSKSTAARLVREGRENNGACACGCRYEHAYRELALCNALEAAMGECERLRAFAERIAERDCAYGDNCPRFGSGHYRCDGCVAREALGGNNE